MEAGEHVVDIQFARQGDVLALPWIPTVTAGLPAQLPTPHGVVVLSQTCDVVRDPRFRPNILVAPVLDSPTQQQFSDARRGRAPLLLHLPAVSGAAEKLADLQHATSVPKTSVIGAMLTSRHTTADSSADAAHLGARVGRTYSRFAFPDEVHSFTDALSKKARETSGSSKPFGRVIDYVEDLRLKANHWDRPARVLTLYVVAPKRLLIQRDDVDPDWDWATARPENSKRTEQIGSLPLARVSELLADACDALNVDPLSANLSTLFHLWHAWSNSTRTELLDPLIGDEIAEVKLVLESDDQFSLMQMRRTASLDLEDLSDSHGATEDEDGPVSGRELG